MNPKSPDSMPQPFWRTPAWGEKSSYSRRRKPSFRREIPRTRFFIFSKAAQKLQLFPPAGKEATIALVSAGDFVGEEALAAMPGLRLATATAITACTALRISRGEMIHVMHEENSFSELFLKFLLEHSMRIQADLVDQLFNSSEKRLARILLLMAEFGKPGEPEQYIPKISQETLAEMIGTTRSRVSFFMNRFRKLGFIEYNGRIKVHKSLLNAVLLDRFSDGKPEKLPSSASFPSSGTARARSKSAERASRGRN